MSDQGMSDQELRNALHRLAPDVEENGVWESLHGKDADKSSPAPGSAGQRESVSRKSVGRRPPTVRRSGPTRTRHLLALGAAVVVVLVALGFGVNALVQYLRQDEQVLVITDQPMQPGSGADEPMQPGSGADALDDRLQELIVALPTPYPAGDVRYASSNPYDYLEDNPAFDEIVAMGYDALPGLDRHLATTDTAGLGDYLVCAAIESITRCDLKQVEEFAWADSRAFWARWNQYLKRMPTLVDEILERDPSFWIQGEEIVKLGAPAVPYVLEYADRIDEQQDSGIPVLLRIPALLSTLVPGSEQAATVAEFKARNAEVIAQLRRYVEDRSVEASGEYVRVLHPYHNEFLDTPNYLIPETVTLAHGLSLPQFPESIPAQRITSEALPDTGLDLMPKPASTGHYLWFGPGEDLSPNGASLGSQEAAAEAARDFLVMHALWDEDYSEPKVGVGSSETGSDTKITSWAVIFEREEAAPGLRRYVSVRVGDKNEVTQV
ncbi:MAG: hypothetical protein JW990_04650, partial [Thermoleophilia bacterium]|nr:hypothetical protein [Thermoleophilia bacterium]